MKKIVDNLAKLINVKTIVTFLVMVVFTVLSLKGSIGADEVMYVTVSITSFYFGTQHEKKNNESTDK